MRLLIVIAIACLLFAGSARASADPPAPNWGGNATHFAFSVNATFTDPGKHLMYEYVYACVSIYPLVYIVTITRLSISHTIFPYFDRMLCPS
jgi:hypothetical protein